MFARVLFLSSLLTCSLLPAQGTAVFPSDHATVLNGDFSSPNWPYAYGVSRIMAVYETWDLGVPAGRPITRIGFRQDGTTMSLGKSLQLQVLMGPTDRTAADALTNFDNNYFSPPTSVFGPALYTLPDLGNISNPNPNGNMVWLTLSTPYTPVAGKNLAVEFRIIANNNGGAAFNYYLDRADYVSPRVTGPAGCPHSGNQIAQLQSLETKVGGTWYCDLNHAPANQLATWLITFGTLQPQYSLAPLIPGSVMSVTRTAIVSPASRAILSASSVSLTPPSEPGTQGMPSRRAVRLASILSPMMRMCSALGPMNAIL